VTKFENVSIDVGGAGDFVPKVDVKIRRIKERFRSIKAGLKWKLPPILAKDLMAYVVTRINSERSAAINLNVAPKALFTGMRMDFRREFCLAFGDYCEVHDRTDNTSRARSIPCLALYPCNNTTSSWAFLNLAMLQRIRRIQWMKMVTTEELIAKVNAIGGADEVTAVGISATPTGTSEERMTLMMSLMRTQSLNPKRWNWKCLSRGAAKGLRVAWQSQRGMLWRLSGTRSRARLIR
jgi:hypothetical protein